MNIFANLFRSVLLLKLFMLTISGISFAQKGKGTCARSRHDIYVIAHRGAHQGIPENSLHAYKRAIELGCDFVEIDIRTTKDGKFVSIHNASVDEYVSGASGFVKEMTLEELISLDIGIKTGEQWKGTRIPEFEEILQVCKGKIGIYLDLKEGSVPVLMEIIRKYDMEDNVIWYMPESRISELKPEIFGNSRILPDPESKRRIRAVVQQTRATVIASDVSKLSRSFVNRAHKCGVKVFADEGYGDEREWRRMIRWKTDGIQTDHPGELILFIQKSGHIK